MFAWDVLFLKEGRKIKGRFFFFLLSPFVFSKVYPMSTDEKSKIYGIDLGTTFSAIAFVNESGKAEIIPNSDNERIMPSVVFFDSPQNIIVGKVAKESAKTDPQRVVEFVKRQMGQSWAFQYEGQDYKPEEISSYILRRLANDAEEMGGHVVRDVVITCPAYFGEVERKATRIAGELAGLNVVQVLDEPAAAALNYAFSSGETDKTIVVYDLGGGTFDVSVVKIEEKNITIICTDGDHRLGGKDWDDRLIQYMVSEFKNQTGIDDDLLADPETAYDLRMSAENAKHAFSRKDKYPVKISHEGESVKMELQREKFEEITRDLLERTVEFTKSVLQLAREKGVPQIDEFLLVGGSTRMLQVARRIEEVFGEEFGISPKSYDVDEAVAKGAAQVGTCEVIRGFLEQKARETAGKSFDELSEQEQQKIVDEGTAAFGINQDDFLLLEGTKITKVATKSYGIRARKGDSVVVRNMIRRQSPVPAERKETFKTADANSHALDLIVFSNNEPGADADIASSQELGRTIFELPPNLPIHSPIEVTFRLNTEGRLEMTAKDLTGGKEIQSEFKVDAGMTEAELEAARLRSREIVIE